MLNIPNGKTILFIFLNLILISLLGLMLFAKAQMYLNFYSFFRPQALIVNNTSVSWKQLSQQLDLSEADKTLKNRQQKINSAINKAVEFTILKQSLGTASASIPRSTAYNNYQAFRQKTEQNLINWRTGGYFIARFTVPAATESAQILKNQAREEISKIQTSLQKEDDFQKTLTSALNNQTLKKLNAAAFLPGMYLERVTEDQFPVQITNFKDLFFTLPPKSVSEIVTLSWDDYYGENYGEKFSGEFAYAVIKIDQINPQAAKDYQSWLGEQREKTKIQSFVFIPFFFSWF